MAGLDAAPLRLAEKPGQLDLLAVAVPEGAALRADLSYRLDAAWYLYGFGQASTGPQTWQAGLGARWLF